MHYKHNRYLMDGYRYHVRQSKYKEPRWVHDLSSWAHEYPEKGWEDLPDDHWKWKLGDVLGKAIPRAICMVYGHHSTPDMCMIPEHDYCSRCMISTPRDMSPFPKMKLIRLRKHLSKS